MRGGIDRTGIGRWNATYMADADLVALAGDGLKVFNREAVVKKAVALTGPDTCGYGADGDPLLGVIVQYEYDGYVTVQRRGYAVDVPIAQGETLAVGDIVCVDGNGCVKKCVQAVVYGPRVESVDEAAGTCVVFLG